MNRTIGNNVIIRIGYLIKYIIQIFQTGGSTLGIGGSSVPLRPRIKRVNLRDMIFYLEQERDTCRSTMLYKSYLK